MHSESQLNRAVDAIARNIRDIPFLVFGEGTDALKLCFRKRGEEIHDDDIMDDDEAAQALQSGVFRRYRTTKDGVEGFRWMRMCGLDRDEIKFGLKETFLRMTHVEIESVQLDVAWQLLQWEQASERIARRERRAEAGGPMF
jgi:hypothetical protein